jgi:hypothetical protein
MLIVIQISRVRSEKENMTQAKGTCRLERGYVWVRSSIVVARLSKNEKVDVNEAPVSSRGRTSTIQLPEFLPQT